MPFCSFDLFFIVKGHGFSSGSLFLKLTSGSRMHILTEQSLNLGQCIKFFVVSSFGIFLFD